MSKRQEIVKTIWNSSDYLYQCGIRKHEHKKIILSLVLLRRLDCILEPYKEKIISLCSEYENNTLLTSSIEKRTGCKFYNCSKYDLKGLVNDPENLFKNFRDYLSGYPNRIRTIIGGTQLFPFFSGLNSDNRFLKLLIEISHINLSPDNISDYEMGEIYRELTRKFFESNDDLHCEYYTTSDVSKLLTSLLFSGELEEIKNHKNQISLYDPCSGTGRLLKNGQNIVENFNSSLKINVFGQDVNSFSTSICKSQFLISGNNPDNFETGSSLTEDKFPDHKFDYMVSHPPFGMSWKSDREIIKNEYHNSNGRFSIGLPRSSDSSFLFIQHLISKMNESGSKIGVILNESPLFVGDSGSGESEIRKWIIENDLLECIVSLPSQLFINTGISTYIWIINNKKKDSRKGKIQLIDGSEFYTSLKKPIGNKSNYITENDIKELCDIYKSFEEDEFCQIFSNDFFGYNKIKINTHSSDQILSNSKNKESDKSEYYFERVPLNQKIDEYFNREVKPFEPNSSIKEDYQKVGYKINFNKVFLEKEIKSLRKEFPSSEWIKLRFIGSFIDKISDNTLLIPIINTRSGEPIYTYSSENESNLPDNFSNRTYKIFKITDYRVDLNSISGYLKSKFGLKDLDICYQGSGREHLNRDSFLDIKIPIIDQESQKYYNLNLELIDKIFSEINTIENEVVYQFNTEKSETIYKRLFTILESTDQIVKEDEINNLIQKGESYFVEFKETFHTNVRNNYKTDKKIRHSSLKTICGFLNSKGGNLLVGVNDDGEITGIEKDNYQNSDHYLLTIKNLLKDRISTNSLNYVDYDIYKINGKRIVLFECQRSKEPVYLDGDHFFVRVNPSTEELKGPDLVKYVSENFNQ